MGIKKASPPSDRDAFLAFINKAKLLQLSLKKRLPGLHRWGEPNNLIGISFFMKVKR